MSPKIGAFFPTRDMPSDPHQIREWTLAAEEIGFDYIEVSDHVLGADREKHENFDGPYDVDDCFHETFAPYLSWRQSLPVLALLAAY